MSYSTHPQPVPEPPPTGSPEAIAAAKGLRVVYPASSELQIDIDSTEQLNTFWRLLAVFARNRSVTGVRVSPSPSGRDGRYHVTVTLGVNLVDAMQRVCLQSLLGSDPVREMLSWERVLNADPHPTLFFELPEGA